MNQGLPTHLPGLFFSKVVIEVLRSSFVFDDETKKKALKIYDDMLSQPVVIIDLPESNFRNDLTQISGLISLTLDSPGQYPFLETMMADEPKRPLEDAQLYHELAQAFPNSFLVETIAVLAPLFGYMLSYRHIHILILNGLVWIEKSTDATLPMKMRLYLEYILGFLTSSKAQGLIRFHLGGGSLAAWNLRETQDLAFLDLIQEPNTYFSYLPRDITHYVIQPYLTHHWG